MISHPKSNLSKNNNQIQQNNPPNKSLSQNNPSPQKTNKNNPKSNQTPSSQNQNTIIQKIYGI
jgi:hypothetical protein